MSDQASLSRSVYVHKLPPSGQTVVIEADDAARQMMAQKYDVESVLSFRAEVTARPSGRDQVSVTGEVKAEVVQICGVTLEPFPARVREKINVTFAPPSEVTTADPDDEDSLDDLDGPDPLTGNTLDLGAIALEFFALGIDPYPRKPGIAFKDHVESEEKENPFAALAKLKESKRDIN